MAENMHKQEWIDAVLGSTEGMSRAEPPEYLFERVIYGLNRPVTVKIIPMPVKQWVAAAILLLALNIGSVVYVTNQNKKAGTVNTDGGLAAEMQLESTYNY